MKNILFIGGAGFIGSNLVCKFYKENTYKIFVYEPPFANLQRLFPFQDKITIIRGTLDDFDLICSTIESHKIDIIVHLVSTLVPGSSYKDYTNEFQNVVFPTARLLTYCAINNIMVVYFSSGGTIYGNSVTNSKFKETDLPAPISYYGLTKQTLEDIIHFEHRRNGLKYLILRPSNPYGHGQNLHGNQGFIAVALGKILAGEAIEIWGDGSSVRDYIYIDDVSDAVYSLLNMHIVNETINIGCGKGYSLKEILSVIDEVVEESVKVIYEDSRSVDVNAMILDVSKLKSKINFHHTHLKTGISEFYNNIKAMVKK